MCFGVKSIYLPKKSEYCLMKLILKFALFCLFCSSFCYVPSTNFLRSSHQFTTDFSTLSSYCTTFFNVFSFSRRFHLLSISFLRLSTNFHVVPQSTPLLTPRINSQPPTCHAKLSWVPRDL